jgi:FkbM family methyltransferase
MLKEGRIEFFLRWYLYRKWKTKQKASRQAELTFHKMMNRLPKGVFLDLGANVGDVTAAVLRYGYNVIAFEPDPTALAKLRQRFEENRKVTIIPKAVGGSARTTTFYHMPTNTVVSSLTRTEYNSSGGAIQVEVVDIVHFIRELDQPVAGIKMDIEGAEAECLETIISAGLHNEIGQIIVECHDYIFPQIKGRLDAIRQKIRDDGIKNVDLTWI